MGRSKRLSRQMAGKVAGIVLPFVGVWMASSYIFPSTCTDGGITLIQPAKDDNNEDSSSSQQQQMQNLMQKSQNKVSNKHMYL